MINIAKLYQKGALVGTWLRRYARSLKRFALRAHSLYVIWGVVVLLGSLTAVWHFHADLWLWWLIELSAAAALTWRVRPNFYRSPLTWWWAGLALFGLTWSFLVFRSAGITRWHNDLALLWLGVIGLGLLVQGMFQISSDLIIVAAIQLLSAIVIWAEKPLRLHQFVVMAALVAASFTWLILFTSNAKQRHG